ncbi:MAG: hypothetical protein WCV68_00860 [Candidatus Paceibacterota bacterium]
MKKKIEIKVIQDEDQRYNTVGDYFVKKDKWEIIVSDLPSWKYEALVAIHELVEMVLCDDRKITNKSIDEFDIEYNKHRPEDDASEPGDDPQAPYYKEHQFATKIEKMMAEELGVDWETYNKAIAKLMKN